MLVVSWLNRLSQLVETAALIWAGEPCQVLHWTPTSAQKVTRRDFWIKLLKRAKNSTKMSKSWVSIIIGPRTNLIKWLTVVQWANPCAPNNFKIFWRKYVFSPLVSGSYGEASMGGGYTQSPGGFGSPAASQGGEKKGVSLYFFKNWFIFVCF